MRVKYLSGELNREHSRKFSKRASNYIGNNMINNRHLEKYIIDNLDSRGFLKTPYGFDIDFIVYIVSRLISLNIESNRSNLEHLNNYVKTTLMGLDNARLEEIYTDLTHEEKRGFRVKRLLLSSILASNRSSGSIDDYREIYKSILNNIEILLAAGYTKEVIILIKNFVGNCYKEYTAIEHILKLGIDFINRNIYEQEPISIDEYLDKYNVEDELRQLFKWFCILKDEDKLPNHDEYIRSKTRVMSRYTSETDKIKEEFSRLVIDNSLFKPVKHMRITDIPYIEYDMSRYIIIRYVQDIRDKDKEIEKLKEEINKLNEFKSYYKRFNRQEEITNSLEVELHSKDKEIADLKRAIQEDTHVKELKKDKQLLIKENKRYKKDIEKVLNRNKALEDKIAELNKEIEQSNKEMKLQKQISKEYESLLNNQDNIDIEYNIEESMDKIKNKRILIIGGTLGLKSNLENYLDNIRVIPYDEIGRKPNISDCDIVAIYYKAISHPDRWSVESQLKSKDIPMVYIGNSNTELVINEIARTIKH